MSTSVSLQEVHGVYEAPLSAPLNEAVWHAWVVKGRVQEERSHAALITAVKWVSLLGLLLAVGVGVWSRLAPYDIGVRFLVTGGAVVLLFEAFHTRHYAFGAVFGLLAVLYNPVVPVFGFAAEWQLALVLASAVPFGASLAWRKAQPVPNE